MSSICHSLKFIKWFRITFFIKVSVIFGSLGWSSCHMAVVFSWSFVNQWDYIMCKSWRCDLICSSEFILERIVFYNVSYYYTLKFKASFLLKRQICHSSLHMCRCFEVLSVNCLTIVFVLTLRYVFAVFLLKIHSKQENLRVGRVIKNPGNLDWTCPSAFALRTTPRHWIF